MEKYPIREKIAKVSPFILVIIVLIIISFSLYIQKEDLRYSLIALKSIPRIELSNNLRYLGDGIFVGKVSGFVQSEIADEQPKNLEQYYIIETMAKFDEKSHPYFSLTEVIAFYNLSPRVMEPVELRWTGELPGLVVYEDANGNEFFFYKNTNKITMNDIDGEITKLVTDKNEYEKYKKRLLE